ncbi:hypothetical protein AB1286_01875 [Trinickia sp. NRRL B-1857]|uniref:hypothetical protein n=1 Tax=Trinickia sp. NRRL B-1857 TaxID=3162879 RepID=UPI003D29335F
MSDTVDFATIASPAIKAESSCIYANNGNQMKITVQFVALDTQSKPVPLTAADLQACVWLIDYNATSFNQNLADDDNWAVDTAPGDFYKYPPQSRLTPQIPSKQGDPINSIDFYVRTDHYVSSVQIGWVIKTTTGAIYTCSSQQLGSPDVSPNYKSPAVFSLLEEVVYTMDLCKVTVDDQTVKTNDHQAWLHSLQIDDSKEGEGVPLGAVIHKLRFNNLTSTNPTDPNNVGENSWDIYNYWKLDRYSDNSGRWWMTFLFTLGQSGNWEFWYKTYDMGSIPYNLDGSSVTSVYYYHTNAVPIYPQDTQDVSPPQFTIFDQFGNWGNFAVENQDGGENGYLVYKSTPD